LHVWKKQISVIPVLYSLLGNQMQPDPLASFFIFHLFVLSFLTGWWMLLVFKAYLRYFIEGGVTKSLLSVTPTFLLSVGGQFHPQFSLFRVVGPNLCCLTFATFPLHSSFAFPTVQSFPHLNFRRISLVICFYSNSPSLQLYWLCFQTQNNSCHSLHLRLLNGV
jgi:hypothetical protein